MFGSLYEFLLWQSPYQQQCHCASNNLCTCNRLWNTRWAFWHSSCPGTEAMTKLCTDVLACNADWLWSVTCRLESWAKQRWTSAQKRTHQWSWTVSLPHSFDPSMHCVSHPCSLMLCCTWSFWASSAAVQNSDDPHVMMKQHFHCMQSAHVKPCCIKMCQKCQILPAFWVASTDVCCFMLQIFEMQEMLGLYGKSPTSLGNYYIATGDCGHILTGGTLAGMIISGEFLDQDPHVQRWFHIMHDHLSSVATKPTTHTSTDCVALRIVSMHAAHIYTCI